MKFDTICLVETPEGIDLHAELVGLVPRSLAYGIDLLVRIGILTVFGIAVALTGGKLGGLWLVAYFLLEWGYPVAFEVYRNGQTIGKKAFNIKVVNDDLTPIQFGPSLVRNLLRTADIFPFFYVFGAISICLTSRFQRLGDLAAGTVVIYAEEPAYDSSALDDVTPVTPVMALSEAQQTAFINFSLNRGNLSQARQQEIAEIIRDVIPQRIDDPVDYVRGVGKWLLGAK
ncbi:RDD family protein [Arenicella xantha]|uniref:Putative RDD family membrane protein YckC n=1 Tax=Arenicella xantha TaxID=644221 RepID=A0A395JFV6_9GAMM|nr:RDD family protein [Arenicella xantha]RBP48301.1 putative RDD family membrane protein YckC [Arenicella xantha]